MPGGTQVAPIPARSHRRPTDATPCRRAGPVPREADLGPSSSGAGAQGPAASGGARRGFLRAMIGLGAVATTAAALTPIVVTGQRGAGVAQDAKPSGGQAPHGGPAEIFDEVYRGRHIRIVGPHPLPGGKGVAPPSPVLSSVDDAPRGLPLLAPRPWIRRHHAPPADPKPGRKTAFQVSVASGEAHATGEGHAPAAPFDILIDGRPLHVMSRADGSYLSSVNHYESFPTLLDVARAAVDELGGSQLSSPEPAPHV